MNSSLKNSLIIAICSVGPAIAMPVASDGQTMSITWSTVPSVPMSGETYQVMASVSGVNPAYLAITIRRDGTVFAQSAPNVPFAMGSALDYGGRPIHYEAHVVNSASGQTAQSTYTVRLTGANTPPEPEILVDGYSLYGGVVERLGGQTKFATVRFRARDVDENLSGIRPNIWHPQSNYFYNNNNAMVPVSGDFGEVAINVPLDRNGDWYFWTDVTDLSGAYASTGHWGSGFKLSVLEGRPASSTSQWLDINGDGILDEVIKPGSTGCTVEVVSWYTYCSSYWWYPVYDSFDYWDVYWPHWDWSLYHWLYEFQYVWTPLNFWQSCETQLEVAVTFKTEPGYEYILYEDTSGSSTVDLGNWTQFAAGNFGGGTQQLSLGWMHADDLYFGQFWLVRLGKAPARAVARDSNGTMLGLISPGSVTTMVLPDNLRVILDALDILGRTLEELGAITWEITPPGGATVTVTGNSVDIGSYGPGTINICVRGGHAEAPIYLCFVIILEPPLKITSVTWAASGGGTLPTNQGPGGGQKVFPDALTPGGPLNNKVQVVAQLNQSKPGIPVTFVVYDVDDPSSRHPDLDRESSGPDNLMVIAHQPPVTVTNAAGTAVAEFEVSRRPGDNYRVVASLDGAAAFTGIAAKQDDGTQARLQRNNAILQQTDRTRFSEMLTVWRRMRLEVDSMGVVTGNTVTGPVTSVTGSGNNKMVTTSITLNDSPNRFVPGTIRQGGNTWNIQSSGAGAGGANLWVVAVRPSSSSPLPVVNPALPVTIADDDFVGDVWEPDVSYAMYLFESAYVELVTGAGVQESDRPFVANLETDTQVYSAMLAGRNGHVGVSNAYWYVYVLGAFQGAKDRDRDPDGELPARLGGALSYMNRPFGTVFFQETLRDEGAWAAGIVAHELGHYFGGDTHETDGSIMEANYRNVRNWTFSPKRLKWIRSFEVVP